MSPNNIVKLKADISLSAPWRRKVVALYRKYFSHDEGVKRVIDIGCSDGEVSAALAAFFPHVSFFGIDTRTNELAEANKRSARLNLANVAFVEDYFLRWREANAYNVATFSEVYEHLVAENQIRSLRVIGAMLRPNGYLIMTCPNGDFIKSPLERYKEFNSRYPEGFFDDLHQTDHWLEPSRAELLHLLVALGYDIVESSYFNLPIVHRSKWIGRIAESIVEPILNLSPLSLVAQKLCKNLCVVARKNSNSPLLDETTLD